MDRDATLHNVFFAFVPDAAMAACAVGLARDARRYLGLTATPIPPERLHVTLLSVGVFSGACPPSAIDAAMRAADTVSMAPFKIEFDRIASFSGGHGKRALVLTGGDGLDGLVTLRKALSKAMTKVGSRLQPQSGSSPHLTMMYDDRVCDSFPIEPLSWTVSGFALVDSLVGQSRHMHLGQWSL
ncbi:MAG: 2'-5' RNA ligase family protein [Hyphomicrobium sp.]